MVHNAALDALESERKELERRILADHTRGNDKIQNQQAELAKLRGKRSDNSALLQKLEKRLSDEHDEERRASEEEKKRLDDITARQKTEETEHFAALWIQLRWKAHLKRSALKKSSKGKKGKKGGKKKK